MNSGISFNDGGFTRHIFQISSANEIAKCISQLHYIILGGDIWKLRDNEFIHTYDNWYFNIKPREDNVDLSLASLQVALTYIEHVNTDVQDKYVEFIVCPA